MIILRRILEKISRHLTFRRRLPASFGRRTLWVTPGAALAYYYPLDSGRFADLFDFANLHVKPGHCVWDVGANLGVFAFAAAHRAGPTGEVLAIEADAWLAELCRRSALESATAAPVQILCAAASNQLEMLYFATPERGRSGSHLTTNQGAHRDLIGDTRMEHPVITVPLDWLLARRRAPAVIKIDVEGAELAVLNGATKLLQVHRPALLIETYEASAVAVTQLLHSIDYQLFDFIADPLAQRPLRKAVYHTLALPRPQ
jgi:FkbM family methyltransferase